MLTQLSTIKTRLAIDPFDLQYEKFQQLSLLLPVQSVLKRSERFTI
jgi:hypothetical protein